MVLDTNQEITVFYILNPFLGEDNYFRYLLEFTGGSDFPNDQLRNDFEMITRSIGQIPGSTDYYASIYQRDAEGGLIDFARERGYVVVQFDEGRKQLSDAKHPLRIAGITTPYHKTASELSSLLEERGYAVKKGYQ